MPDDVLNKIKYLCKKISKVEWSGILMYTVDGTIKKPEEMIITLKDIIPMNKGSKTYTEYSFNEKKRDNSGYSDRHIDYIEENEEALYWHLGVIHSHNSMETFFSGTDMSELNDNSNAHNFYLSLIVNNFMDFKVKIAFRGTVNKKITIPYIGLDENGNTYEIENSNFLLKKEKLYVYDCNVVSKEEIFNVDNLFLKNVSEIIENADNVENISMKQNNYDIKNINYDKNTFYDYNYSNGYNQEDEDVDEVEMFTIHLLNFNNKKSENIKSIDVILKELEICKNNITEGYIYNSILNNYDVLFRKYIGIEKTIKEYYEIIEEVLDLLEYYSFEYKFIDEAVMAIKELIIKIEENESKI